METKIKIKTKNINNNNILNMKIEYPIEYQLVEEFIRDLNSSNYEDVNVVLNSKFYIPKVSIMQSNIIKYQIYMSRQPISDIVKFYIIPTNSKEINCECNDWHGFICTREEKEKILYQDMSKMYAKVVPKISETLVLYYDAVI